MTGAPRSPFLQARKLSTVCEKGSDLHYLVSFPDSSCIYFTGYVKSANEARAEGCSSMPWHPSV